MLGLNEEAYVEVEVGRLAATGRNPVHVDVEDGVIERPHVESGLLARFPQRDRKGVGISVAVTSGLQPARRGAVSFWPRKLSAARGSSTNSAARLSCSCSM